MRRTSILEKRRFINRSRPDIAERNIKIRRAELMKKTKYATGLIAILITLILCSSLFSDCFQDNYVNRRVYVNVCNEAGQTTDHGVSAEAPRLPAASSASADVTVAPSALGDLTVSPLNDTDYGVMPDSQFLLKSTVQTSAADLADRLSVRENGEDNIKDQREGPFTLTDGDNTGEYLLSFNKPLDYGSVYNLVYTEEGKAPLSYAFQTADKFGVTGTNANNQFYDVTTDARVEIEIDFNRIPAADYAGYISSDPPVSARFEQDGSKLYFIPDGLRPSAAYIVTVGKGLRSRDGETLGSDYAFRFFTNDPADPNHFNINGDGEMSYLPDKDVWMSFVPGEGVYFNIISTQDLAGNDYGVTVYRIQSADEFKTAETDRPPRPGVRGYEFRDG